MGWIVIRVRGTIHARGDIVDTLAYLHLTRANHATVLPETPRARGMLTKVQGYVTWGESDPATVELLLKERGETPAGTKVASESKDDLGGLAKSIATEGLSRVSAVRPLFRLGAPRGGWRSTKKPFTLGGALGYRGAAINDLVRRMV